MVWYYVREGERMGPLQDAQFDADVQSGAVTGETLVWHDGMPEWRRYAEVRGEPSGAAAGPPGANYICAECGNLFPAEEMIQYGNQRVCAACKPVFFQRLQEGAALPGTARYAGFWIRVGAQIIDSLILGAVNFALVAVMGIFMGGASNSGPSAMAAVFFVIQIVISMSAAVAYETWMVGKYRATLGKMACGLIVVTPQGGPITYWRAFGRYWGKVVSGLILYIGYFMIGFDEEKRGLHDRMCDTRVVYK